MYIHYKENIYFKKELLDQIHIRDVEKENFWYHHGESPKTHKIFLAAIKRAKEMQEDGNYKTFNPYEEHNEIDRLAYEMFFSKSGRIRIEWDEEKQYFNVADGRHRLRMMQLHDIEMEFEVDFGFTFRLLKDGQEIKKDEKIEVERKTFWNFFDKFIKPKEIKKQENIENITEKRVAVAVNIEDLTDDILEKLGIEKENVIKSYRVYDENINETFGIFDDRNYDLEEIINKLKSENIEIYEGIETINENHR